MTNPKRLAVLRIVVLIALAFRSSPGDALGLGPLRLHSALGQPLQATVQVLGPEARTLADNCIRTRLLSPDGSEILRPETQMKRRDGQTEITVGSRMVVEEPAVTLSIEVTCAPELHRDYQLLLDLRDGLPRVLAQDALPAPVIEKPPAAKRRASAGSDTGAERRSRRPRTPVMKAEPGLSADAMEATTDASEAAVRTRARGLPGARNVLKLSQAEFDLGKKPAPGLRLSESLSTRASENPSVDTEEILAAKARFLAMMRNEDPVQAAQREIRGLQAQLLKPPADGSAAPAPGALATGPAPAADVAAVSSPSIPKSMLTTSSRRFGDFNFWLIGLGALLLATLGVLIVMYRGTKRTGKKSATPWWMAADDAANRETELLQVAREIVAGKKKPGLTPQSEASAELDKILAEDALLHRYVSQFVPSGAPTDAQTSRRVEPSGLVLPAIDMTPSFVATAVPSIAGRVPHQPPQPPVQLSAAPPKRQPAQKPARQPVHLASHDDLPPPRRTAVEIFELVSDVMQEAEFWKMLNETKRAIDILEGYCYGESPSSPVPWLYLADLYHENGDREPHARLRDAFREHFNGRMADDVGASGVDAVDSRRSLEEYPYLMQQISGLWGQHEVVPFLQGLLVNDRDAPRQGFNLPVYREILLLIDVAQEREQEFA